MKAMITNWKVSLLLLFVIIIAIEAYYILALRSYCYRQEALFYEALEWYQKHDQECPYSSLLGNGQFVLGYLSQGNLQKALAWSNLIIDTDDGGLFDGSLLLYVYNLRGDTYYKMGEYVKAIDDYSTVINVHAQNADYISLSPMDGHYPKYNTYIKRAMAFRNCGDDKSAVKDFCYGVILNKNSNSDILSKFDDNGQSFVLPPSPDDLLDYLEKHHDMIDDEVMFGRCVQILNDVKDPVDTPEEYHSHPHNWESNHGTK